MPRRSGWFVVDSGADEVIALRAADLQVRQRWPAPGGPQLPLVNSDGIVCVTGPATGTADHRARRRGDGYDAQNDRHWRVPHDPLLTRDGAHIFVPCAGGSELVKVRLADGSGRGRCEVGDGPSHLALASGRDARLFGQQLGWARLRA